MARVDGNETDAGGGSAGSPSGGPESVDIGSHIDAAIDAARSGGPAGGSKRIRRTKAQLEADGYYTGADTKTKPVASPTAKKGALDVNSIQFALTGIHALLAAGMHAPELELSDTESETVAKNLVAVARHYDLQQTAKATDWGNLVVSLGVVYGGRIIRISARKKAERIARGVPVRQGTGFVSKAPNVAPQQPVVTEPTKAGIPGARPRTDADLRMLDEHEAFVAP